MQKLELNYPLKKFIVSQKFGENANGSYAAQGLKGHTGIDLVSFWNDVEMAAIDSFLYKTYNFGSVDLSKFRAVCTIVILDDGVTAYEIIYGHCHNFLNKIGVPVKTGDPLATEGNTGAVYVNGIEVTEALKEAGSQAGTHLHFQVRLLQRTKVVDNVKMASGWYLISQNGSNPYIDPEGFYYFIPQFENGYNGCVDPEPFWTKENAAVIPVVQQAITVASNVVSSPAIPLQQKVDWLTTIVNAIISLFHLP